MAEGPHSTLNFKVFSQASRSLMSSYRYPSVVPDRER
jgi:hypothetical protein